MNQQYLQGLHKHLGITHDYDTWVNTVKDNNVYLEKLYNINFEFQTDGAKKVYKSYLDMETITLDKLNESLDILKARKKKDPFSDWKYPDW